MKYLRYLAVPALILFSNLTLAETTSAQVPIGIAISKSGLVEVNFPNMSNNQQCTYNGAFVIDPSAKPRCEKDDDISLPHGKSN